MPIRVECPACHKSFTAPDEYAGREDHCPACRAKITIPLPFEPTKQLTTVEIGLSEPKPKDPIERIALDVEKIRFRLGCLLWFFVAAAIAGALALGPAAR